MRHWLLHMTSQSRPETVVELVHKNALRPLALGLLPTAAKSARGLWKISLNPISVQIVTDAKHMSRLAACVFGLIPGVQYLARRSKKRFHQSRTTGMSSFSALGDSDLSLVKVRPPELYLVFDGLQQHSNSVNRLCPWSH